MQLFLEDTHYIICDDMTILKELKCFKLYIKLTGMYNEPDLKKKKGENGHDSNSITFPLNFIV